MSIVFDLERTNQLSLLPDKDLVDLCPPIEPYQVTKNHINNNPMTGTYKRNYEGDYRCHKEEIEQMFRDASNEPQDFQVLDNFNLNDIDPDTLKVFRQRFSNREPDHPWLAYNDQQLLHQLGGWRRDRNSSKEGLTVAGLLMFG
ncbi:MAG: hypothetical protein PX636_09445 [Microcystis sp. M53598_WE2]|uniref:hypothetical protein n=1 Tax=Microcystis sp. M53598_WE2 TaxID=3030677 RepID=UPI00258A69AD|nr:hypothetical protein [Microcystis sp. M53598_WE2]MDJ0671197.1 hypothetical protein [Microcystis sp. M53598_WE2]